MKPRRSASALLALSSGLLLSACTSLPGIDEPRDPVPVPVPIPQATNGAIYAEGSGLSLFEDAKARNVGDVITIVLVENTAAKKSATTNTSKNTATALTNPTVFGKVLHLNGGLSGSDKFAGEGDSAQSNQLSGSITAMVMQRLPNGNLMIRGDKLVDLNQGSETIRIEGVVRPVDIATDNSVTSDRIAAAHISYKGKGALADANAQGWLARFFNSPWFPF
jgi:flagellar L-ring protein precursor FlgH